MCGRSETGDREEIATVAKMEFAIRHVFVGTRAGQLFTHGVRVRVLAACEPG